MVNNLPKSFEFDDELPPSFELEEAKLPASFEPDQPSTSSVLGQAAKRGIGAALRTPTLGASPEQVVEASKAELPPLTALKRGIKGLGPSDDSVVDPQTGDISPLKAAASIGTEVVSELIPTRLAEIAALGILPGVQAALIKKFPILNRPVSQLFSRGAKGVPPTTPPVPVQAIKPSAIKPDILKAGKAKLPQPESPALETRISEPTIGKLTDQVKALKDSPIATDKTKRAFERLIELVERGEIQESRIAEVAAKEGISNLELAQMIGEEFSRSGRILQKASSVVRALGAAFEKDPAAKAALGAMRIPEQTPWMKIKSGIKFVENARRRLLVTQLATAMRNISSQGTRSILGVVDDALTGATQTVLGKRPIKANFANALEDVLALGRTLSQGNKRQSLDILKSFPVEAERLLGTPVGDVAMGGKIGNALNVVNIAQEHFFRRMIFDARMMGFLRSKGVNLKLGEAPKLPPELNPKTVAGMVDDALEITFAKTPARGTFFKGILNVWDEMPFLTAVANPFPRFLANSLEFTFNFSPLGYTRLFAPSMRAAIASGNTRTASKAFSQATIGTMMLHGGYSVRESDIAGPRWYQIKMPGGRILDTRAFAPFSTYLFIGEVIRQAQGKPTQLTPLDWLQGLVSINRISGTALVLVDILRSESTERTGRILKRFAGEWAGSFSVPARTIQQISSDLPGEFGKEERIIRSRREDLLTGPFRSNLPGISQGLPPSASAFQPSPIRAERGFPTLRQTTGLSIRPFLPVEAEANRLGVRFKDFSPRTGDATIDRLVLEKMGPITLKRQDGILQRLDNFDTDEEKAAVMKVELQRVRARAVRQVMAENEEFRKSRKLRGTRGLRRILFERQLQEVER